MTALTTLDRGTTTDDLRDRAELSDLISRLYVAMDAHQFDDLRGIFTDDATATTPGGMASGREALIEQAARNHTSDVTHHHLTTNVLVEVDGDRASVRANQLVLFNRNNRVEQAIGTVNRFTARRTADGWRLTTLDTDLLWRQAFA